jgi:Xylanase inhibitor C-terminal
MFSYCLPSRSSYTGYLSIGKSSVSNAVFTSMVQKSNTPSYYYVTFTGLKVGGQLLKASPIAFSAGAIIDSGTVITRLPPTVYAKLRSRFKQLMKKYRSAPSLSILDTCYDFTRYQTVSIPTISFFFSDGTTLDVDFTGILYVSKLSQASLAFFC